MIIPALVCLTTSLQVTWVGEEAMTYYPWIWLRDHAHDAQTIHPQTQQRQLYTADVPCDLVGSRATVVNDQVEITWNDRSQPSSRVPVSFLYEFRLAKPATATAPPTRVLWELSISTPTVPFDEVMNTEAGLEQWLTLVSRFGFCVAVNTPATTGASENLLRRVSYVRETIFGAFWEFTADLTKADTAYTNLELRPHTDGTYSLDAPGAQLLHCLHFDGTGGESTIVDGFALAAALLREHPQHYETLSRVAVPGQYIGDGSHLVAARPVLSHDAHGALVQVSFNNYDRAPFLLEESEMIAFYDAIRAFEHLANDVARQWRKVLAPGDALLFDNWRVLHGRAAYTGVRQMCGGYVNHEDMVSRSRLLRNASQG